MRAWRRRPLSAGEQALARTVFGEAVDLQPVRLLAGGWPFRRAFVPGRWLARDWIVWPAATLARDLSRAPLGDQATLVHELVHVWQAQQGVRLAWAKLGAGDGAAAYRYATDESCRWVALNIEQQAMVVEHAFRLSRGAAAPASASFYRAIAPFPCGLEGT